MKQETRLAFYSLDSSLWDSPYPDSGQDGYSSSVSPQPPFSSTIWDVQPLELDLTAEFMPTMPYENSCEDSQTSLHSPRLLEGYGGSPTPSSRSRSQSEDCEEHARKEVCLATCAL